MPKIHIYIICSLYFRLCICSYISIYETIQQHEVTHIFFFFLEFQWHKVSLKNFQDFLKYSVSTCPHKSFNCSSIGVHIQYCIYNANLSGGGGGDPFKVHPKYFFLLRKNKKNWVYKILVAVGGEFYAFH